MSVLAEAKARPARFLMLDEVAERIGAKVSILYRERVAGVLPCIKIRRRWVVPSRAIWALEAAARAGRSTVIREDWDYGWSSDGPVFYPLAEAAAIFRVSMETLKRNAVAGEFPAVPIRKSWYVPASVIDDIERAALEGWTVIDTASWRPGQVEAAEAPGSEVA